MNKFPLNASVKCVSDDVGAFIGIEGKVVGIRLNPFTRRPHYDVETDGRGAEIAEIKSRTVLTFAEDDLKLIS